MKTLQIKSAQQSAVTPRFVSLRTWCQRILPGLAMLGLALIPGHAMAGFGNDTQGCAADRPCFNEAYQAGNQIHFKFTGICCWDFYNVRYAHDGGEKQVENRSGSYTFTNVSPRMIYTIKVQGCNSHTLAHSTCSPWSEQSVRTR
jgi:hypothetical protein